MVNISNVNSNSCTGCCTCLNVCPVGAISMKENKEGFLCPVVDSEKCTNCGLCLNVCPVEKPDYSNDTPSVCYAYMNSDDERLKSSSGAAFPFLADYFISNDGYVSGAIWDDDWSVKHVVSDDKNDIEIMRSSKYLQSKIGFVYKEIKNLLKQDKKVLFTGTPCQVAGLKSYLHKDYDNLYCLDIICLGVPSAKVFKKYLKENYDVEDIKNINFRDKKINGWGANLNIDFNSKESKTTKWNYDSYFSLFLNNMCLRKSCGDCKFAKIPRQGDLTIGDFWGASPDLKDKMGTSLLISNNKKGEFLLDILKKNAKLFEQQPLEVAIKENPYLAKSSKPHIDRDKFFNALENHSVNDLKRYFLDDYCDCMVLNFWSALNYGAILTCYGVQCLLQELGKTTKVINYVSYPKELECNWEESFANKFANKYLNLTKPIKKYSDLLSLNQKANTFVVGSDQVFRKGCIKELVNDDFSWTMFFLDFVRSCNKKISYSASFGVDRVEGTLLELEKIYYYLAQFDDISVREKIATVLLENKFRLNSKMLVDGVFHIPKSKLIQMTSEYETQEEYIGCYVLPYFSNKTWYQQKLQSLSSKLNLPIKTLEFNSETPVEKWLAFIKNAKILISDSYHAVVFSLIFNTPFVQIKNAKSQTRFETLFDIFGIKNKTVSEFNQELFDVAVEADFDWENINKIIEVETQKAKNWMKNALEKEKENKFISPHFLEAEIIELKQKIRNLEELNQ